MLGDVQDELPLSLGARRRNHRRSGRRGLLMRAAPSQERGKQLDRAGRWRRPAVVEVVRVWKGVRW